VRKFVPVVLMLFFCAPAFAGMRYTLRIETLDGNARADVVQNAWLQGAQAKFVFDDGLNSQQELEAERYGERVVNVDPERNHGARIVANINAEPRRLGTVKNISTSKIFQERGPMLLGHPTVHIRFVSQFDYEEYGVSRRGTMSQDVWVAADLHDADLMKWMMFEYKLREDEGIEGLYRQVSTLAGGLPLSYDGIARIKSDDGNTEIIRLRAKVDSLESVNVDPSVFTLATNRFEVVAGGQ
jgi:hypothetical protein